MPAASGMRRDVDRLVRAAERLHGTWPSQPPPAVPEVALVAGHGKAVAPLLMALLSRNAHADRDRRRWQVQQQATLALSRIYAQPQMCGRIYCDGDPPARIARVREAWLRLMASDRDLRSLPVRELIDRFRHEPVFWRQLEVGRALAAAGDRAAIAELEAWLTHEDRHVRGNVALVLGRLGDPRGFDTIAAILADRSTRPEGQGGEGLKGRWSLKQQILSDRYYAAHLLGELKDPRGVDVLLPLLDDEDVGYKVPWSLAEIGDRRAIAPLIAHLAQDDPSVRVYTMSALEQLNAHEALPTLRELLADTRTSRLGSPLSVADAARHAIAVLSHPR
jgi:HEAT repeat protein